MEFAFYIRGLIAILATLRVVTHTNPVHALLYLIISLLAIAGVFFSLGAYFRRSAGNHRLRRGHYGAVRLRGDDAQPWRHRDRTGAQVASSRGSGLARPSSPAVLLVVIVYAILALTTRVSTVRRLTPKKWALRCLSRYVLAVELASMPLLAGLVVAFHIGREERAGEGAEQPSERQRQTKNGGTRMIP